MKTQPAHSLQQRKAMNTTDSIERSTAMNQFSLNPDSRTPDTANPFGFRYDPRGSAMYAPFCALLDTSYSMNTTVGGAVTRFQAAVKSLGASLRRLKEDDVLSDGVHLFLYTFGKSDVRCIRDNIALAELDIDSLERELLGIRPDGNTPMGAALEQALKRMEAVKAEARARGENYKQPLLCITSDGEPTDSMDRALELIDQLQRNQKMALLPFAIGAPGAKFPLFERMCAIMGGELQVLNSESDIRRHFRLIDATIRMADIPLRPISEFASQAGAYYRRGQA